MVVAVGARDTHCGRSAHSTVGQFFFYFERTIMANAPQNYGNHTRYFPVFHFAASPLGFIFLIWSGSALNKQRTSEAAMIFVGALALVMSTLAARLMALRVQDRVIRLEERLRLARLLPAELQGRIEELRTAHLVGLRFASDAEVAGIVSQVLANPAMTSKEIKLLVKAWRPDYLRA